MTPEKELKELQRQFVSAYSCPKEGCRQPLSYPPDYYEHQKKACPCGKLKIQ
jgi:hypothetical protein